MTPDKRNARRPGRAFHHNQRAHGLSGNAYAVIVPGGCDVVTRRARMTPEGR